MKWVDFRKNKPKKAVIALVANEKGWMHGDTIARYHQEEDSWVLDDLYVRQSLLLEVTHYIPIPEFETLNMKRVKRMNA